MVQSHRRVRQRGRAGSGVRRSSLRFLRHRPESTEQVYDVQLRGNKAIVRTGRHAETLYSMNLYYGYGNEPVLQHHGRGGPVVAGVRAGANRRAERAVTVLCAGTFA